MRNIEPPPTIPMTPHRPIAASRKQTTSGKGTDRIGPMLGIGSLGSRVIVACLGMLLAGCGIARYEWQDYQPPSLEPLECGGVQVSVGDLVDSRGYGPSGSEVWDKAIVLLFPFHPGVTLAYQRAYDSEWSGYHPGETKLAAGENMRYA
ncbi:MAG: hypothetical protein ACOC8D_02340, partial [bacterium]